MRIFSGHSGPVFGLDFAPDGSMIASASGDSTVRVWSAAGAELPAQPIAGHLPGHV